MSTDAIFGTAASMIREARRVVVLTGAGISTRSGIPDFRGPQGLWTLNPKAEKMSNIEHYINDPEVRRLAWQSRLESPAFHAAPNEAHRALVALERRGNLGALVTQNVDGLHQAAGSDPALVVEVHGTLHWSRCWSCNDRRPMLETLERVTVGDPDPSCHICGGILKSDTISFGQSLVPEVIERAMNASDACDLLLAVGSSLGVYPVANMVPRAKAAGSRIVIVNGEPTAMDRYADAVIGGDIVEVLPRLIDA
jgi:NAD-dependent deacetylase